MKNSTRLEKNEVNLCTYFSYSSMRGGKSKCIIWPSAVYVTESISPLASSILYYLFISINFAPAPSQYMYCMCWLIHTYQHAFVFDWFYLSHFVPPFQDSNMIYLARMLEKWFYFLFTDFFHQLLTMLLVSLNLILSILKIVLQYYLS